ncbi:50S ribosomal protein L21 [Notoacmeibacter sp. MSK16QG-6]|uniref:50S ribosomal protein L21 n=1 Tax=Notoacmeibacter sp. MSK16QG-6 TaxID=2957982 RepID=UPI0020A13489|nr:50S ribosomal protein L21 [Notoacmeibacter sp. MSK16QG-6]MCP1200944.1 50S ribosomal protein L21 [Notoacmeibacter sp. MSK16QG-6]
MFAVIKTGGKQYRVAADDQITIERLAGEVGDSVTFESVLMIGDGDDIKIGAPLLDGLTVSGEIVDQHRGKKVISFKKRRRQNSRRKRGHRQLLSTVRITEIAADNDGAKKPAKKAAPKKAEAPAKTEAAAAPAKSEAAAKPAEAKKTAKSDGADDLKKIKGIGPKAAEQLNDAGITTYAQLAALTDKRIDELDADMPFSAAQLQDWREQAKELAG